MKPMKYHNHKTGRLLLAGILAGMIATLSAHAARIEYTYDDAGRLTQADYGGGTTIDYVYDANGNLLQRTVTGSTVTYTLIYRAGTGGWIDGVATQEVVAGGSGSAVTAMEDDASVVFRRWSDGHTDPTRTDTDVWGDLTVRAAFRSTGGADLDWYATRDIEPGLGEDWTHVDARAVPAKGTTLLQENIADTDPDDTDDVFRVIGIEPGPPVIVYFRPGSTGRVYSFQFVQDLADGIWTNVPGVDPRFGHGGEDAMEDANGELLRMYRIQVELP